MITKESLIQSETYKQYIGKDKVSLIHNIYYDHKDTSYPCYIVIHSSQENKHWYITKFFEMGGQIEASMDHQLLSTEDIFAILLTQYSSGAK